MSQNCLSGRLCRWVTEASVSRLAALTASACDQPEAPDRSDSTDFKELQQADLNCTATPHRMALLLWVETQEARSGRGQVTGKSGQVQYNSAEIYWPEWDRP